MHHYFPFSKHHYFPKSQHIAFPVTKLGNGSTFWFSLPKSDAEFEYDSKKTAIETQNEKIQFNKDEITYLLPFMNMLSQFSVYEFSDVRNTILKIDALNNPKIETWKNSVMAAMKAGNEEKYYDLISIYKKTYNYQ